jgi:uncharacterized protein (DUF305 family)
MKRESIFFGLVGILIGVMIMGFVASYSVNHGYNGIMRMMGVDGSHMMGGNVDRNFIEQMIPHHESAIAMAKLAQQKASRSEIKTLADNIIKNQTDEIIKMRYWYEQWYGAEVPKQDTTSGMMSGMHNSNDIDSLREAVDFDKAFLEEMIPHHQMAVMMANMLENTTSRQEMKNLARDIIAAQTKEIDAMQNWQAQWGYIASRQSSNGRMDMRHGNL